MEFTNSNGVKYYLHKKMFQLGRNTKKVLVYNFKKIKGVGYTSLPVGYTVFETRSGLPFLKKI